MKIKPLEEKYNLWNVVSQDRIYRDNKAYAACRCDCGTLKEVIIKNLKNGGSKSCGCLQKAKLRGENYRHGKHGTRTYRIWGAMKTRCNNKNFHQYKDYGGRGVKVCDEWINDFMAFYSCVGDIPKGLTIDRIDNNGDYEPGNVRLATYKEQGKNKRDNHKINGECITHTSKKLGGEHGLVGKRLRRGWSEERAISEPIMKNQHG
jgi:hypothetical protein